MEYQHHIVMIANHNLNIMMTTIGKDTTGILGLKSLVELTTKYPLHLPIFDYNR